VIDRQLTAPVYQALKAELDLDAIRRILQAVSLQPEGSRLADLSTRAEPTTNLLIRSAGWLPSSRITLPV